MRNKKVLVFLILAIVIIVIILLLIILNKKSEYQTYIYNEYEDMYLFDNINLEYKDDLLIEISGAENIKYKYFFEDNIEKLSYTSEQTGEGSISFYYDNDLIQKISFENEDLTYDYYFDYNDDNKLQYISHSSYGEFGKNNGYCYIYDYNNYVIEDCRDIRYNNILNKETSNTTKAIFLKNDLKSTSIFRKYAIRPSFLYTNLDIRESNLDVNYTATSNQYGISPIYFGKLVYLEYKQDNNVEEVIRNYYDTQGNKIKYEKENSKNEKDNLLGYIKYDNNNKGSSLDYSESYEWISSTPYNETNFKITNNDMKLIDKSLSKDQYEKKLKEYKNYFNNNKNSEEDYIVDNLYDIISQKQSEIMGNWIEQLDYDTGELAYYLTVDNPKIYEDDYIDIYVKLKDDSGNSFLGKILSNVKVLAAHDSGGRKVYKYSDSTISKLGFGVNQETYVLLKKAESLTQYSVEIIPVLSNQNISNVNISYEQLKKFIDNNYIDSDDEDVILTTVYPDFTDGTYTKDLIQQFCDDNRITCIFKMVEDNNYNDGAIILQSKEVGNEVRANNVLVITIATNTE